MEFVIKMDRPLQKVTNQPYKKHWKKIIFFGMCVITFLFYSWFYQLQIDNLEPSAYQVSYVENKNIQESVRGFGKLMPLQSRFLTSNTISVVEELLVKQGDIVTPETIIVQLKSNSLGQEIFQAKLRYERAKLILADAQVDHRLESLRKSSDIEEIYIELKAAKKVVGIYEKLIKQKAISELKVEQAKVKEQLLSNRLKKEGVLLEHIIKAHKQKENSLFQLANQESQVLEALKELSNNLKVKAGMNGQVTELNIEKGQTLQLGGKIATISTNVELIAEMYVSQDEVENITINSKAVINTGRGLIHGRVERIVAKVKDGVVPIQLSLSKPYPLNARNELRISGRVFIGEPRTSLVVQLPHNTTENTTHQFYLVSMDENTANLINVKLGNKFNEVHEILSGLSLGDKIITNSPNKWNNSPQLNLAN